MLDNMTKILSEIKLPEGYTPSDNEEYMCDKHLKYFQEKLLNWKQELITESENALKELKAETEDTYSSAGDDVDRANDEAQKQLDLQTRERERKIISQINSALKKINDKSFGYCEITDEPIGLKRLEARPIATMTVEAQEEFEANEKMYK